MSHKEAVSVVLQRSEREKYLRRFLAWAGSRGTGCLFWPGTGSSLDQNGAPQNQREQVSGSGIFFSCPGPWVVALGADRQGLFVGLDKYAPDATCAVRVQGVGETKNSRQMQSDLLLVEGEIPQCLMAKGRQLAPMKARDNGRELKLGRGQAERCGHAANEAVRRLVVLLVAF